MDSSGKKYCPICEQDKPHDEFYTSKNTPDGLQTYCKVCFRVKTTEARKRRVRLSKILRSDGPEESKMYYLIEHVLKNALGAASETIRHVPGDQTMRHLRKGLLVDFELLQAVLLNEYVQELKKLL